MNGTWNINQAYEGGVSRIKINLN